MADKYYRGGAAKTPKYYKFVISGTPTASGDSIMTINSKTVTVAAAAAGETYATIATKIYNALINSGVPGEFKMFTWSNSLDGVIEGTGPADGRPVTITSLTVAGATVTTTNNTSSSPYDLSNTVNWVGGALPTAGDTAIFDIDTPVRYNLGALSAVDVDIKRTANHQSDIGLPDVEPTYGFAEYLDTKLATSGLEWNVADSGGIVRLSATGAISVAVNITGPAITTSPRIEITGASATWSALSVVGGSLTIISGTVSAIITAGAQVLMPNLIAVTVAEFNSSNIRGAMTVGTSIEVSSGSEAVFLAGSSFGSGDTLQVNSSTVRWESAGQLGVLTLNLNSILDCSRAPANFAVLSIAIGAGSQIQDPFSRLTRPYTMTLTSCTPTDIVLNLGRITSLDAN